MVYQTSSENKVRLCILIAMQFKQQRFSVAVSDDPAPYQFTRTALLPSSFSSSSNNAELGVTIHFGGT